MLSCQPVLLREGLLNFQRDAVFPESCTGLGTVHKSVRVKQLQANQVLPRIQHAIAVIDPNASDRLFREQAPQHAMGSCEDLRVLHAQTNQIVDVEEAAIVDLLAGDAPMG